MEIYILKRLTIKAEYEYGRYFDSDWHTWNFYTFPREMSGHSPPWAIRPLIGREKICICIYASADWLDSIYTFKKGNLEVDYGQISKCPRPSGWLQMHRCQISAFTISLERPEKSVLQNCYLHLHVFESNRETGMISMRLLKIYHGPWFHEIGLNQYVESFLQETEGIIHQVVFENYSPPTLLGTFLDAGPEWASIYILPLGREGEPTPWMSSWRPGMEWWELSPKLI